MFRRRIVLDIDEIYTPGMKTGKKDGTQYETHVLYKDIVNIFITTSNKNSLGEDVQHSFASLPYLVFECRDGSQKAINVLTFTKKQVMEIINQTIMRAKEHDNELLIKSGMEIMAEFLNLKKK